MNRQLQVNATKPRIQYRADGGRREFLFPFVIFADADLEVYVNGGEVTSGYAVGGVGNSDGGSVIFATPPTSGATVTLRRRLVVQRTTAFQESGPFRARVLNDELDYLTAALQQLETEVERSLRLAPADVDATTVLPDSTERAGRALAFDANGNVTMTMPGGLPEGEANGWRTLDDIPEGTTAKRFDVVDEAKLDAIEPGAQVNPPQVSLQEKALATEAAQRSFSPRDLADMVAIHAPVHEEAVASVHGRTGAVIAQPGDYTAEQIAETAARVVMTAEERAKLAGVEPDAQVNAVSSVHGRTGTVVAQPGDYTAEQIAETAARVVMTAEERAKLAGVEPDAQVNVVTSVHGRIGTVVGQPGDYTAEQITETAARVVMTAEERTKLAGVEPDAQVNVVTSVHGRIGTVVGQPGDYTAEQITETAARVVMTAEERAKLAGVEPDAQVNAVTSVHGRIGTVVGQPGDYTAEQITETAARVVMTAEERAKLAGVEPDAQVNAVTSVHGRIGTVVGQPGDYTAEQITETAARVVMTAEERAKLAGVEPDAQVNAVSSVHGRTGAVVAQPGDYTAEQIAETAARVVMTAEERAKLAGIAAGATVNPPAVSKAEKSAPVTTVDPRSFSPYDIADLIASLAPASVVSIDGGTAATQFAVTAS